MERKPDSIDRKLSEALDRAENYGNLRGLKETADDYLKGVYAVLYLSTTGTVAERDSIVKANPEYQQAVKVKSERYAKWTAAEIWMKVLFAEVEKYRTDTATERSIVKAAT